MKFLYRNYVNWFGPYHLLDPLEKLLMKMGKTEDEAYAVVEKIADRIPNKPFELAHRFRKSLPWNKNVVKIDRWDTWSMDVTLAHIIVPMLKQLKETKHGVPMDFAIVGGENYEQQLSFDFYQEDTADLFEEHGTRRWDEVLDKMIWSFEQRLNDSESSDAYWEPYWEVMDPSEEVHDNSVYKQLGMEHPRRKINKLKYDEYNARLQEGFELFGKYYSNLWD